MLLLPLPPRIFDGLLLVLTCEFIRRELVAAGTASDVELNRQTIVTMIAKSRHDNDDDVAVAVVNDADDDVGNVLSIVKMSH